MNEGRLVESAEAELRARISELSRELERERAARQDSERALVETVDAEHGELARLLHDTSSQSLNAARIYARITRNTVRDTCPEALTTLQTLEDVIESATQELQNVTRWISPARLEGSDLVGCLAELCQLAAQTAPCEFRGSANAVSGDRALHEGLLRIAQLALHALVRRCQASGIEVELQLEEQHLALEIRASSKHHLPSELEALLSRRARALGGSFTMHEAVGGNVLSCRLPKRLLHSP